jgi:subtilase family serine protease
MLINDRKRGYCNEENPERQRVFIAWKRNTTSEYAYLSLVRILYVV